MALAVFSAGSNAWSGYTNSVERKAASAFNARLAGIDASDALLEGEMRAQDVVRAGRALRGQQEAAFAANGVAVNAGSAGDLLDQTDFFTAADAHQERVNASRRASRIRLQGANYQRMSDAENPTREAFTSVLGSSRQVADSWYRYTR